MTLQIPTGMAFVTPEQFVAQNPFVTLGQLRWWLYWRSENGLDRGVRKVGRRLYLKPDVVLEWIDEHASR